MHMRRQMTNKWQIQQDFLQTMTAANSTTSDHTYKFMNGKIQNVEKTLPSNKFWMSVLDVLQPLWHTKSASRWSKIVSIQ